MFSDSEISLKKMAATASIGTALVLCVIKAVATFYTGSLSVLSSMIDSLSDVVSSMVTFVAVKIADKPLTDRHRYGYGKAECVSALVQAAFIVGSAAFILYDGVQRFMYPMPMQQTTTGIIIMLISLAITFLLIAFQNYVVKKTKSKAIAADSMHYVVDILSNSAVILSLAVVHFWHWEWFDILTAVLIAVYLIFNAYKITVDALGEITDAEVEPAIKEDILKMVRNADGVLGCHDFRSRVSGARMFIELHLELDGNATLFVVHDITENVEQLIKNRFPQAEIIIHQDPHGINEYRLDHQLSGANGGLPFA